MENVRWNEALAGYQDYVTSWHDISNMWASTAGSWHSDYLDLLRLVREYSEAVTNYHTELENSLLPVLEDLSFWSYSLQDYEQELRSQLESFLGAVELQNIQAEITNTFMEHLLEWHLGLDYYYIGLFEWTNEVNYRQTNLNIWQDDLYESQQELLTVMQTFQLGIDGLPNIPDAISDIPALTLPVAIPSITTGPALTINWPTMPIITTSPMALSLPPDINTPYMQLQAWYAQLQHDVVVLQSWQNAIISIQNNIGNQLTGWYNILQQDFGDLHTWQHELAFFSENMNVFHENLSDSFFEIRGIYGEFYDFSEEVRQLNLPDLPPYNDWEHLEIPSNITQSIPNYLDPLEQLPVLGWDDVLNPPNQYDGAQISDVFNQDSPIGEGVDIIDLDNPPDFTGYQTPEQVGGHDMMTVEQPRSPLIPSPPRPDNFWQSLDFMHEQLLRFDVDDFLTDDIRRQVETSLQSYGAFLDSIRDDIAFMFEDNIWRIYGVRDEYGMLLNNIRTDAFIAAATEQETLRIAIDEFVEHREHTNEDTLNRLISFQTMMPQSRLGAGINQTLLDFSVSPFDFAPVDIRDAIVFEQPESLVETFQRYQLIALIALGIVLLGTLASVFISYQNRRKKRKKETSIA